MPLLALAIDIPPSTLLSFSSALCNSLQLLLQVDGQASWHLRSNMRKVAKAVDQITCNAFPLARLLMLSIVEPRLQQRLISLDFASNTDPEVIRLTRPGSKASKRIK